MVKDCKLKVCVLSVIQPSKNRTYELRHDKTHLRGFPSGQTQKVARGLKFQIKEVEGLCYLYSKNKGVDQLHGNDQLHGYRVADLYLCLFAYAKTRLCHEGAHIIYKFILSVDPTCQ